MNSLMVSEEEEMSSSESPSRQMTVVDVYDLASVIGKDFERLIDQFGADSVTHLMPKVISALELLEAFATRNERENDEIVGLKSAVTRLEAEKVEKKEGRQKFETELEQIEETYRTEIRQLWEMVQKLQEENKRLCSNLEEKVESPTQALKEDELKVMLTLRQTVDKQRDCLKGVQKESDEKAQEIDSLHQQIEKLQRNNKELNRKNKAVQNQGRSLVEEKADLISLLQDREQFIVELQLKLGETEKAKKDLEETKGREGGGVAPAQTDAGSLGVLNDIRQALRNRFASPAAFLSTTNWSRADDSTTATADVDNLHGSDRDNVPRFTLAELREVLQEKNQLKARVMELEDELAQLRPAPTPSPHPSEKNEEEELVVYGPINREPEEKLYPWRYQRKDSGVRKFLQNMFQKREQKRSNNVLNSNGRRMVDLSRSNQSIGDAWTLSSSVSSSKTPVVATARYRPVTSSSQRRVVPRRYVDDVASAVNNASSFTGFDEESSFSSSLVSSNNNDAVAATNRMSSSLDDEFVEEPIEFSLNDDSSSSSVSFNNSSFSVSRRYSTPVSSSSNSTKLLTSFQR